MRLVTSLAALAAALALAAPVAAETYHGTLAQCADGQQLQLRAGQRYRISASSASFDTVLRIVRQGSADVLAQNDDADGTNSRLLFTPGESGAYRACVAAFSAGGTGAYTVTVEEAPPLPAPVSRPTTTENMVWQVFDGTLAAGDQEDGGWFDDYQITIPAGERAMISAESDAFDTVVKVYRADQRGGDAAATDDDSGGGLNSFLLFAPEDGGDYIVRVTSYGNGAAHGGAYRLRIAESAIPRQPDQAGDAATGASGD
jgi:hypothetical protein